MKAGLMAGLMLALVAGSASAQEGHGTAEPIPEPVWTRMQGVSWHDGLGCPARGELRLLTVPYVDFFGDTRTGRLIVAAAVAGDVLDIFAELHAAGFPIQQMRPVYEFGGQDALSMSANNTSAFNCRMTTSGSRLSEHSFGTAIDINPVQNPYVTRRGTQPAAGAAFDGAAERQRAAPGVIRQGDVVVRAFKARGWGWGGDWTSLKDYQHFSTSGR